VVLRERAGVIPVAKAVRIMSWIAANHRYECKGEQHKDQDDLASGEPEFRFAIVLDGQ
jgi:hypothetical protein